MNVKMRARLAADALRSSVRSRKRVDTEPSGLRWSHQPTRPTVSNRVSPFWHGKPHRLLVPRRREVRGTGTRGAKSHFFHRVAASVSWSNSGWLCCTYTTFFFLSLSLRVRCTGVRRLCAIVFCPAYVHVRKGVFAERERERERAAAAAAAAMAIYADAIRTEWFLWERCVRVPAKTLVSASLLLLACFGCYLYLQVLWPK